MSNPILRRAALFGFVTTLATPLAASAEPLTVMGVFQDAAMPIKLVALALVAATLAAAVVCAVKLASGAALSGGSAFLSGLRLGGPLLGLVGAAYTGFVMTLGMANAPSPLPTALLAHGWAEVIALVLLGVVSGAVAVMAKWAVDSRIDRAVLKG